MNDQHKTKAQLIKELEQTRGRIAELVPRQADEGLHDLIEIIQLTEHVSTKIHDLVNEAEIFRTVKEEFAQLKRYTTSIVLLTDDDSSLRIAEISLSPAKVKAGEKATGLRLKGYKIDLKKSSTYRQVVREGKTVQVSAGDIMGELFPRPLARLALKALGLEQESSVLTPLKRHGKIIGAFALTCPELAEYFIPSVKNLAQHISNALEWADEYSEHERAEEELRESEEKYRTIFENVSDSITYIDKYGTIIDANDKEEIFGRKPEEIIGKRFTELGYFSVKDIPKYLKLLRDVITGKKTPVQMELEVKHKDGHKFPVEMSTSLVKKDGKTVGFVCITRDITERKRAEEALLESEEKYRSLVESSENPIYLMDEDLQFLYANEKYLSRLGKSLDEVIGQGYQKFHPPKKTGEFSKRIEEVFKTSKPVVYEHKSSRDNTDFLRTLSPVIDPNTGRPTAVTVISKDITGRRQAEDEQKESREQLRSLSAHLQSVREESQKLLAREIHDELGQDLTALKMDLSWVKGKLRQDQELLREKAAGMTDLANTMIQTVKRISTQLRPALLDDLGVVAAIEWELGEFEKRAGIGCELTVEPEEIDIDPDRATAIYRIFQEALTNIARHAQATNVKASLKVHTDMLVMEIRDNGIGITEEQIANPKSFGLIGIRERVLQWDGEATIKGRAGKGTTLAVTIPLDNGEGHND